MASSRNNLKSQFEEEGKMELFLYSGGWGLPSIDPESLQSLAAVRIAGAPTSIHECNNPWKSPRGTIPFFKQTNSRYLFSAHDISSYLRTKNFSGDYGLSSKQCSETVAYSQLIWESLHVAYQYFFWVDDRNYGVIRPFYGSRMPWVHKCWYPDKLRRQAKEIVVSVYRDAEDNPQNVELFIVEKAKRCINNLSQKLGSNEFFMGTSSPTTMDAIAFSYLAVFWRVKLPNNPIKEFIMSPANANLVSYLTRILQRYFPVTIQGRSPAYISSLEYGEDGEPIVKTKEEDESFPVKQKVAVGLMASIIMLFYAIKNGIVRLPGNSAAIQASQQDDEDEYWE